MWIKDSDHFTEKLLRTLLFESVRRLKSGVAPSTWRAAGGMLRSLGGYLTQGLWHGKVGWNLLLRDLWYNYKAEQLLWLDTVTGRKTESDRRDTPKTCMLYYNYYRAEDPFRRLEIDYCLSRNVANTAVSKLFVLTSDPLPLKDDKIEVVPMKSPRPTFAQIFQLIGNNSGKNDCNIVINSDCFLVTDDQDAFDQLDRRVAWCIGRLEIPRISPLLPWTIRRRPFAQRREDSQDCWIIRGKPAGGMWLDFTPGLPGCDNRLAYELHKVGYVVHNPMDRITVYHMHAQTTRDYTDQQQVPKPYLLLKVPQGKRW
jgi:hypothetical protein